MKRVPLLACAAVCVILIAGIVPPVTGASYLVYEQFETAVWPPTGWSQQGCDKVASPDYPSRSPIHSVLLNKRTDSLRTPFLKTPETLTFYLQMSALSQTLSVKYSTSQVGQWTDVPGSPFSITMPFTWTSATVDLSAYTNIYLQFTLTSTITDYEVCIDDVSVTSTSSGVTPTPTPVPTPSSQGYLFVVDDVPCEIYPPTSANPATCNRIVENSGSFNESVLHTVVEAVSGSAKGKRFFVDSLTSTTLFCNAGLLDDPATSAYMAGVEVGDKCSLLFDDQVAAGQCVWLSSDTLQDISGATTWATDAFAQFYVYLEGDVSSETVRSFFTIGKNTNDSFTIAVSGLPEYTGVVNYLIMTNPSPVQTTPLLTLETDSYPDTLCDTCIRLGLNYTLTPLMTTSGWNPLNQVDPYVAALLPTGKLLFFHNGGWHENVQPVYRGFVIGSEFSGTLGVFLMGPSLPAGTYTIYGLLNTPGASVWNQRYWRSDLTSARFVFP